MENQSVLSANEVGSTFCECYYKLLQIDPNLLSGFYDDSTHNSFSTVRGVDKILTSLQVYDYNVVIRTTDSQFSLDDGLMLLVNGSFVRPRDNHSKNFSQTFFLAPRPSADGRQNYVVVNDIFTFHDDDDDDCLSLPTPAERVDHSEDDGQASENMSVESVKTEASIANGCSTDEAVAVVPAAVKKSFASVVGALKTNPQPFQMRAPQPKPVKPDAPTPAVADPRKINGSVKKNSTAIKPHSIFVPSLPLDATEAQVGKVFKKFGSIKTGGIQVRSKKQQGVCFAFVEYESVISVQNALRASPVAFGSRKLFIEQKRATTN